MTKIKNQTLPIKLHNNGYRITEIARLLRVSKQRIHQIVKNYNNSGRKYREEKYFNFDDCEICYINPATHLHHKDFNNENDKSENLIPTCNSCHSKLHKLKREGRGWRNYIRCKLCKREFNSKFPHCQQGLCKSCVSYTKSKKKHNDYRHFNYPKYCINCRNKLFKNKRKNGRCLKCQARYFYRSNIEHNRKYHREYYYKCKLRLIGIDSKF